MIILVGNEYLFLQFIYSNDIIIDHKPSYLTQIDCNRFLERIIYPHTHFHLFRIFIIYTLTSPITGMKTTDWRPTLCNVHVCVTVQ